MTSRKFLIYSAFKKLRGDLNLGNVNKGYYEVMGEKLRSRNKDYFLKNKAFKQKCFAGNSEALLFVTV